MKKIILILTALLISFFTFAQTDTVNFETAIIKTDQKVKQQQNDTVCSNCVMMKEGKMMIMSYGKLTQMTSNIILINGTQIITDGTIISKDGTQKIMKEGDYFDISEN